MERRIWSAVNRIYNSGSPDGTMKFQDQFINDTNGEENLGHGKQRNVEALKANAKKKVLFIQDGAKKIVKQFTMNPNRTEDKEFLIEFVNHSYGEKEDTEPNQPIDNSNF
ncbi:hypothetical protein CHUAL_005782 [Chamberlinius hualienensis]